MIKKSSTGLFVKDDSNAYLDIADIFRYEIDNEYDIVKAYTQWSIHYIYQGKNPKQWFQRYLKAIEKEIKIINVK